MKKLISFIVTTVVTAIGFSFWRAWNSKNEEKIKSEEEINFEDDFEDNYEDFIGEPSPVIDILEEEISGEKILDKEIIDIEVEPKIAEKEDKIPSRGLGDDDLEEIPKPPTMEEELVEIPEPPTMEKEKLVE
ncbi:MAG: hypothetical protein ACPG49_07725, partial [Chitinophagales bacterium]